jgi:hypothetical protein
MFFFSSIMGATYGLAAPSASRPRRHAALLKCRAAKLQIHFCLNINVLVRDAARPRRLRHEQYSGLCHRRPREVQTNVLRLGGNDRF